MSFVKSLEVTDVSILSYCGASGLCVACRVCKRLESLVMSPEHDEELWRPAAAEFIEGIDIQIVSDDCPNLNAEDVAWAYEGYRQLLRFRRTRGFRPGWERVKEMSPDEMKAWYHPFLEDPGRTAFFLDYFSRPELEDPVYLMTQVHGGLVMSIWNGEYRGNVLGTTREYWLDWPDEEESEHAVARKQGPYEKLCRPALLKREGCIIVQVSAIDFSMRGQFCREVLLAEMKFRPSDVLRTRPHHLQFYHASHSDDHLPGMNNPTCAFTWNDNFVSNRQNDRRPPDVTHSSAAWLVSEKKLLCFFKNAERFLRGIDDKVLTFLRSCYRAHVIVHGRQKMGEPIPLNPVLAAHLNGPFDYKRMSALELADEMNMSFSEAQKEIEEIFSSMSAN